MDDLEHTVKGALETILWFEDSLTEVEGKTGELFRILEQQQIDPEPLYEIFKVYSQIRFHMAEAHEYQALLNNRQSKKYSDKSTVDDDADLARLAKQAAQMQRRPFHRRLESRLTALLKHSFSSLRKAAPQSQQAQLM